MFTIIHRELTDLQCRAVNSEGWATEAGIVYLNVGVNARDPESDPASIIDAVRLGILRNVAKITLVGPDRTDPLEMVFTGSQNLFNEKNWVEQNYPGVRVSEFKRAKLPRSTSVGDIIYDHEKDVFNFVASVGFEMILNPKAVEALRTLL